MNIAEVGFARSILGSLIVASVAIFSLSGIVVALSVKAMIVLQADARVRANDPGKRDGNVGFFSLDRRFLGLIDTEELHGVMIGEAIFFGTINNSIFTNLNKKFIQAIVE
jgi:hypothetical protein